LWVNPGSETDAGATARDTAQPLNINDFAFRQSTGIGNLFVDNLIVGTTFADVVSAQPAFRLTLISVADGTLTLQWETSSGRQYRVEAASNLAGCPAWTALTNVTANGTNVTLNRNFQGSMQFFRVYRVP
jgi:hypothetical protein